MALPASPPQDRASIRPDAVINAASSLRTEALQAGYGRTSILRGIDAVVTPGCVTALVGPNGSGKSTLLRCLAGALRPTAGHVLVDGHDLHRLRAAEIARRIAYVPQDNPAPFAFTVEELVRLAPGATPERVEEAIAALEMGALRGRALTNLSGGERQRAAIARGLAQHSPWLLLDEPTAHLDPRHQVRLFETLRARTRQEATGVLVVLHSLEDAARWADQVMMLHDGRIADFGPPSVTLNPSTLQGVYGIGFQVRAAAGHVAIFPDSEPVDKELLQMGDDLTSP